MDEKQIAMIRLVSSRYNELQGLRAVLIGGAFALTMAVGLAFGEPQAAENGVGELGAIAAAFVLIIPGMLWLDRYYQRTFGRMTPTAAERRWSMVFVPGITVGFLFLGKALGLGMTLFFVSFAAYEAWILVRDWPWRPHYLLGIAGSLGAAAALWMSGRPDADEPMMRAFLLFGVSMVPVGFRDHLLLQHTVHGSQLSEPEHAG